MSKDFVHLHLHTEYSLLDGFARIDDLFDKVKSLGMKSVAITDHGSMFGVVEFYKKAIDKGIKPIIGCEVYVAPRSNKQKDPTLDRNMGHLVLLVENETGYKNLIKLVSSGFIDGFYYKPRIDYDLLKTHSEGLIACSACLGGDVQRLLIEDRYEEARNMALRLKDIMGEGNFYLELQDHGIPVQKKVNSQLVRLSRETEIPMVATNDVHYLDRVDSEVHDILLCIQTGKTVDDADRMKFPSDEFYLKSREEMGKLFPYAPEALDNTVRIAERCSYDFDFETLHLPAFPIEDGQSAYEKLRELCFEGLHSRYKVTDEHVERLEFEIDIIHKMGYEDYFLIVWDFIKYAKENGIFVGPGRGSCGGSMVAYVLEITEVDPIKYDLIFERFLNPERITMPDIDIDFEDDRRQEVIDYVVEKYGKDHVAQIITFGTMAARGSIRDVGRVLNIPYQNVDKIAKEIPFQLGMTIDKAFQVNPKFTDIYESEENAKQLIDFARKLEGVPRHASTHAAGVVIAKNPVDDYVPLYVQDGNVSTQFNMVLLEELGLLKMDFLGLRTLTVIKDTMHLVEQSRGIKLDINTIPLDDQPVYNLISSGNTMGIFQLESAGMIRFMRELKPNTLEDIIAGISLYRPGPMDSIPKYIKNKNNPREVKYLHGKLEDILGVTYGCLVYQEQVMRIVRELGGYSYGRSDLVRRAMSKKKMKVMEQERDYFINGKMDEQGNIEIPGCVRNGVPAAAANEIFDDMIDFAKYAFNKSHAAGYAIVAYQTAYLKAHYPVEFMAALMTSVMGNQSKLAKYIQDCKDMKIEVLPPSVNESYKGFTVVDGKIRFGLLAVKNVGTGIIKATVDSRKNRQFKGFVDYCENIDSRELNKKAIESLIKAGAFDDFNERRSQLLAVFEKVVDRIHNERKRNAEGQVSLFNSEAYALPEDVFTNKLPDIKEFPLNYLLTFEKEILGIYLSGHPLSEHEALVKKVSTLNLGDLKDNHQEEQSEIRDGMRFVVGGLVTKITNKITKNNRKMAFITLEDLYSSVEVIIFPKVYDRAASLLYSDSFIIVSGRLNLKEDEDPKIMADEILELNEVNAGKFGRRRFGGNGRIGMNQSSRETKPGVKPNNRANGKTNGSPHTQSPEKNAQKDESLEDLHNASKLYLKMDRYDIYRLDFLKKILSQHKGITPVYIYLEKEGKKMLASEDLWVNVNRELINELRHVLGADCVKFT